MSFAPYLAFQGNCREAMTRYAEIFGANDLQIMSYADAPPEGRPSGPADRVMHSQFSAGPGAPLLAADMPEGMGDRKPANATVFHGAPKKERAEAIFAALAEGGHVTMPLAPTFWSPAFGMVTDRWNTSWMITVATET